MNPHQQAAINGLKRFLRQRGDSAETIEMTAALATDALLQHRAHFGELLEHGPARYQHDPDNDMSYFATLRTPQGRQTIWGVDLKRTLEDSGAAIGEAIVLAQPDHRPVTVSGPKRDGNGKTTGRRISIGADRNRWEVISLDNARDFARQPVQKTQSPPVSKRQRSHVTTELPGDIERPAARSR